MNVKIKAALSRSIIGLVGVMFFCIIMTLLYFNPIDVYINENSSNNALNTISSKVNQYDGIAFTRLIEFYDKLITFLIALLAISGIAAYFYIKSVSSKEAEDIAIKAVERYVDSQIFNDYIVDTLRNITEVEIGEYHEAVNNYSQVMQDITQFKKDTIDRLELLEEEVASIDKEEEVDDVEIKSKG